MSIDTRYDYDMKTIINCEICSEPVRYEEIKEHIELHRLFFECKKIKLELGSDKIYNCSICSIRDNSINIERHMKFHRDDVEIKLLRKKLKKKWWQCCAY